MTAPLATGAVHKLGDDINTDYIIAGKYTKTLDYQALAAHLFEDLDPDLAARVKPGDCVIAGENFGCGSSREQAPLALKHAGIAAVLAKSFARIFFRNAINVGLPALVCDTDRIARGDTIEVDLPGQQIRNLTTGQQIPVEPLAPVMTAILQAGGLVPYLKTHGRFLCQE